jgi:putative salt-induced outer membrane protein YdiY
MSMKYFPPNWKSSPPHPKHAIHRKGRIFLMVVLMMTVEMTAADIVTLQNGDRVSGFIRKADAKGLILKTEFMGEVTVARTAIATLTSDQALYVLLKDGQTLLGTLRPSETGFTLTSKDAGTIHLIAASIDTIRSQPEQAAYLAETERYRNPGLLDLWAGAVDLGLSLTSGNSRNTNLSFATQATRETRHDKGSVYMTSVYGRSKIASETKNTAGATRGGARYEKSVSDRMNLFGFGDLEQDVFQKLGLRMVLGGGLGNYFLKNPRTQFQIFGGFNINKEYFSDGLRRNSGEVMMGEGFSTKLSDRFSLTSRLAGFHSLNSRNSLRVTLDASAVTTLSKWLNWHLTFSNRFLNHPVPGATKNDILLTTGLRLTFRR